MTLPIVALLIATSLSACSKKPIIDAGGSDLPPVKEYSESKQRQVAEELRRCGDRCKAINEVLSDGKVLRDQVRAGLK